MPRPRATMEESTGGTQTTTIAAGTAITDASADPEFTPDFDPCRFRGDGTVDIEDENIDLGLIPPAVVGDGSKPRRSTQKEFGLDLELENI